MLGAGLAYAGTTPAGIGLPSRAPATTGSVFQDPITGEQHDARRIVNGSYVFGANGRIQGMTAGQQYVLLAFSTKRASTGDKTVGERISSIQDIGPAFAQQVASYAQEALADGIRNGLVALLGVTILPVSNPDGRRVQIAWRDLSTGKDDVHFI